MFLAKQLVRHRKACQMGIFTYAKSPISLVSSGRKKAETPYDGTRAAGIISGLTSPLDTIIC